MSDLVNVTLLDSAISFIQEQLQAQNMTISVLSNLTDIPVNTINNILYRRTRNPGFEAVASMVYTLGGSMDALANKVTVAPENTSDLRRKAVIITAPQRWANGLPTTWQVTNIRPHTHCIVIGNRPFSSPTGPWKRTIPFLDDSHKYSALLTM